jgi:hypothetical protein
MTTAVLDIRMDMRSHEPNNGQIRDTIKALSSGWTVAWFGDVRVMKKAIRKVANEVPAAKCRAWVLDDVKRQRVVVWSTKSTPAFAYFTGRE